MEWDIIKKAATMVLSIFPFKLSRKSPKTIEITITGMIVDEDGTFIDKAVVAILGIPGYETSDNAGYFNFHAICDARGEIRIHISKEGYEIFEQVIRLPAIKPLYVVLKPKK